MSNLMTERGGIEASIADFLGLKPREETRELVRLSRKVKRLEDRLEDVQAMLANERKRCRWCWKTPQQACRRDIRSGRETRVKCPKCRRTIKIVTTQRRRP
jgi:hypothetical protein